MVYNPSLLFLSASHPIPQTTDLLSAHVDRFAFSIFFVNGNIQYIAFFLPSFFHSVWDSSVLHMSIVNLFIAEQYSTIIPKSSQMIHKWFQKRCIERIWTSKWSKMKTIDETGQRIDGSSLNYFFKRIKSFIKMKFTYCIIYPFKVYNLTFFREFPGGPVVRSLHFHRLQGLEKGHIWEGHHFVQHSVYSLLILKLLFVFLLLSFVL